MSDIKPLPEFRFYYFTNKYEETVSFYKNILQLDMMRTWDRGAGDKGTIFYSPNGTGLIEIEEGTTAAVIQGALYIEREVSGFSFLVSRFWFLVSRFSFLVSRFSFLVNSFLVMSY